MQANFMGHTTRFPPGKEVLALATSHQILSKQLNRAAVTLKCQPVVTLGLKTKLRILFMTHLKASARLNSHKYDRITQNLSYKHPTFKKMVHRRFCGTAQTSRRPFICYKSICSEITRKFSDPKKCYDDVNLVLTHILDPT